MTAPRTNPESTFTPGKAKTARKTTHAVVERKSEQDMLAQMSAGDRANYTNTNMDRLAPKTRAKLDAYQAEGHAHLPRDNFAGLTPEEIRARILSGN